MNEQIDYQRVGGYGPDSTPGHSGSATSEAAALSAGVGRKTMRVHEEVVAAGRRGLTASEVGARMGVSHGSASGALSRLQRAGLISRITETRHRQQVYVSHQDVEGRATAGYRPNAAYREDRRPMPLERPEPTLESVIMDLQDDDTVHGQACWTPEMAEMMAPRILQIIQSYQ